MFGEEMKMDSGKWADSESVKTDLVRFSQASIITLAPTQSKKKKTNKKKTLNDHTTCSTDYHYITLHSSVPFQLSHKHKYHRQSQT